MATSIIQLVGDNKEYVFKSVKIADAGTENGSAVALGSIVTGNKDVYTAVKPATANLGLASGLVAKEFIKYVGNEVIDALVCNVDEIVKAVFPQIGQEVVLTNDASTGTLAVGSFASPVDGVYKLAVTATVPVLGVTYRIVAIDEPIRIGQRTSLGFRVIRER